MLEIIILILLLIVSAIDFKSMAIPSIFLTSIILVTAILNPANLFIGIIGFIMAYMLWEGGFFDGVGDIKVMTAISFMIPTINWFFVYVFLVMFFGVCWKAMWNVMLKKKIKKLPDEFPFLPVFCFVYISLYFLGVFA
jgi:hypothetical protein